MFVQYKLDKSAFSRYTDFLNSTDDMQLNQGRIVQKLYGEIQFNSVSFGYENRIIFDKFDLKIKQGETIAFVGESGSGKSTLIKLLVGLLKPTGGEIMIDNNNLSELKLNSYYNHISYISQESPIFDGTLRENIVFDKDIDDEHIKEILKKVCLFELFSKLKNG